jgi:hypothetical protein
MSFINDYEPDYDDGSLKAGEYGAEIERAETAVSKNGNDMIRVTLSIEGKQFFWHIVAGNWFNSNCTKFCICFGIRPGSFNFEQWRGKRGTVGIKADERNPDYFNIAYLVAPESGDTARKPDYNRQEAKPGNAGPSTPTAKDSSLPPDFNDDIPF